MSTDITSKEFFFSKLIADELDRLNTKTMRVLELGCGTAPYAPAIIDRFSNIEYQGVEPFLPSFTKATERLDALPRATVYNQLGYDGVAGLEPNSFDLIVSFSVLEHVKQLDRFIELGAKYAKTGALVVHRYDLGHALYPASLKERVQVWLGNNVPAVLPEHKFVRYVPAAEVARLYVTHHGAEPFQYTYHQMPNTKRLATLLRHTQPVTVPMRDIYEWEFTHSKAFAALPLPDREYVFPTVAVWGRHI